MRYASTTAFRTALETRLNAARTDAVGVSRLRKRVVFDRLLARLHEVAPGAWVLKGGFALELRLGVHARTTKDIDADWKLDEEDAIGLLIDAAALGLDDAFEFGVERASDDADFGGGGQRWSVTADLAGRQFERVAIDVGFATEPVLEPHTIVTSQLLAFADVPPVPVPAVAIEQHVAERLRAAIEAIFSRRATHEAPTAVPAPPRDWAVPWRRLVAGLPADVDVDRGHQSAVAFLDPVLAGAVRVGDGTRTSGPGRATKAGWPDVGRRFAA